MHLYNRIIVHNGHIVCRDSFQEIYGEIHPEDTDGKHDATLNEYIASGAYNPDDSEDAWLVEYAVLHKRIKWRNNAMVNNQTVRPADMLLDAEKRELWEHYNNYLKLLNEGK